MEEMVLQGMTDKLIEAGRRCGMEMNVGGGSMCVWRPPFHIDYDR
jgi:hypothetical protein